MTDGLKDRHREAIIAVIAANDRVERAVLFGSRATGTNTVSSDVDIALFGDELTLTDQARLAAALDEIPMAQSVDLLLYDSIQDQRLREHIHAHGIELYAFRETSCSRGTKLGRTARSPTSVGNAWAELRLGQVIELKRGYDLPARERLSGPVPVVSSSGVTGYHRERKVPGPGVVTGRYGTLGEVYFIPDDFWPLNTTLYVRDFKGNDPRFIGYLLRGLDFSGHSDKAAVPGLNRNHLHEEPVRVPRDVREQRAIAHVLGTLDDKIELNRRMNETLEAMARALFKSWFVDFDPVRAKMEGRDTGLPKEIADLLPSRLVDSELGEIPEGWRVATLGDISEVVDCLHSKKPDRTPEGKPLLQLWNIRDNGLTDMSDTYFIDEADYEKWTSRIEVREGDCVITNVGRVGAVSQIPRGLHAALGRNMTGVRCIAGFGYPTFVIAALLSDAMRWEIDLKTDSGTILNSLNVRSIPKLRFVRAPEPVLTAHERIARPMRARMEENLETSRTLAALRDTLLPMLISGEIRTGRLATNREGSNLG